MAEETPRGPGPSHQADQQDDVLGKIDQLLSRHRPKTSAAQSVPMPTGRPSEKDVPLDDGIPILMDVVTGPGRPLNQAPASSRAGTISSALLLQRMAIALDAEHIRLLTQIDRDDTEQARMLDRLVGELKRALPGALRAALAQNVSAESRPGDDGSL